MHCRGTTAVAAAVAALAQPRAAAAARTWYVSNFGNDSAPGNSSDAPWATLTRVNAAVAAGTIAGGDTTLLQCGSTFVGTISKLPPGPSVNQLTTLATFCGGRGGPPPYLSGAVPLTGATWQVRSPRGVRSVR